MLHRRHASYPNLYLWLVLLSSLDIFLTWIILHLGGREANPIANHILSLHPKALIAYKFAIVVFLIVLSEVLATRSHRAGKLLLQAACGLTCLPIVFAMRLLLTQM